MSCKSIAWISIVACALVAGGCKKKPAEKKEPSKGMAPVGMDSMGSGVAPMRNAVSNPCKPSSVDRASLHASVLFKTGVQPPKGKKKELFDCAGRAIALYSYEFESPKKAAEAAMVMGAQLWGGPGPSPRHRDEIMVRGAHVVVLSPYPGALGSHLAGQGYKIHRGRGVLSGRPQGHGSPAPAGLVAELASLHRASRCPSKTSPWRHWCIVTMGWQQGTPAAIVPKGKVKVFLGFALPIKTGVAVNHNRLKLAAFVARKEGDKHFGSIINIRPDNDKERKMMAQAVFDLALVFKGRSKSARIPAPLLGFLRGQAAKAPNALTRGAKDWTLAGKLKARIRQVGSYWVALERDPKGLYVNLFTDRFEPSKPGK